MKSSELHRIITRNGWKLIRSNGSHYMYEKDGIRYPVPFHGSKEVVEGLRKRIFKIMNLG
jgi:mRNA interferase HicA